MTTSIGIKRPYSALSKRSRSTESNRSNSSQSARKASEERMDDAYCVPAFLRLTRQEILERFQGLESLQRGRMLKSVQASDPDSPWAVEQTADTRARNRYTNVYPWANNRVHLQVPPDHCDYINASPIILHGSKPGKDKKYIATQGPKEGQFSHIWRMIWHEATDPAVIVMLTQTWEAGRDKCFQYFPEDLKANDELTINDDDEFGDGFKATVKLLSLSQDIASRSAIRKMTLTVDGKEKTIWHLLFSGWPDFCVPEGENQSALLRLIKLSEEYNTIPENPRIVHCSAGVGRSGTFIALDYLLQELDDGSIEEAVNKIPHFDPVFDTVNKLREQRMTMVQSDSQLVFIYQVLKERWLEKRSTMSVNGASKQHSEPQAPEGTEEPEPRPPGAFPED
ncbi:hypothetical protein GP486_000224 [Trichoglossum hirsutum]|uniref:Uncharacterized protein n=1 Tax=Trichoglossum hirsutum TaxID=265104 RepID=A0A9P8LJ51_9PEZI|nr:hypothetical protein GP486_000224 [Trichoglossum hirsutum]